MSTLLKAPHPNHKVTTTLPNPQILDAYEPEHKVFVKRGMTGKTTTYVASTARQTLRLGFLLTRSKFIELQNFVTIYRSAEWQITLYDNSKWVGRLTGNVLSSSGTTGKSSKGEFVTVQMEFSGIKQ